MTGFKLTHKARSDLISIARYTQSKWGNEQRNLYLQAMDRSFHKISLSPDPGRACDHICIGYRKYPQGKHIIYYKQETSGDILIIRILHKQMDVTSNL